ncbi:hypothetical protein BRC67_06110 [Halobacteriales archaeon QH_3_68_24]|nr:MAG: hypothetical protein BRC67_06110 [Halobacteriales archaeon QH_3_68_24]
MGTLSRVAEPFWTREFVAKQLWLLIGVVTFGLVLFAAALDFDALARVIVAVGWFLLTPIFLFFGSHIADAVFEDEEAEPEAEHLTGPHRTCKEGPAARDGR